MSAEETHCAQMTMAVDELAQGKCQMRFSSDRPQKGRFYAVTGKHTNIKDFLEDFKKAFGENIFDLVMTREQCQELIDKNSGSFSFREIW